MPNSLEAHSFRAATLISGVSTGTNVFETNAETSVETAGLDACCADDIGGAGGGDACVEGSAPGFCVSKSESSRTSQLKVLDEPAMQRTESVNGCLL
jgi:hypothetical protein